MKKKMKGFIYCCLVFKSLKEAVDVGFVYGLSDVMPTQTEPVCEEKKSIPNSVEVNSIAECGSLLEQNDQQSFADEKCNGVEKDIKTEDPETSAAETSGIVEKETPPKTGCSKGQLLLSPSQLVAEGYPLPGSNLTNSKSRRKDYVFTHDVYLPVTNESPMFALDCEWCVCIDGKK